MHDEKEILVIEPDEIAVTILTKSFELAGYKPRFHIAQTAIKAQEQLFQAPFPPVIFIEPVLPDMSALKFLHWLHEQDVFSRSRVYILSAIFPEILDQLCKGFHPAGCLAKPMQTAAIKKIMDDF